MPPDHTRLPSAPRHDRSALARQESETLLTRLQFEDAREDAREIDLLAYARILLKRRRLIIGCLIAAIILAILKTLVSTPLYRATTVIQIEKPNQQVVREGELTAPSYGNWDPDFLSTQVGLLRSHTLAERVVDELGIDQTTLNGLRPQGWMQRLSTLLRPNENQATAVTDEPDPLPMPQDEAQEKRIRALAIAMIKRGLSIQPRTNSRLVDIAYTSTEPRFSARVADAIADGYIASEVDRRFGVGAYAKTYLEEQLAIAKSRLEDSERALVEFAQRESLVNIDNGSSLVERNLTDLNTSLAQAQSERIRAQSRWSLAQSGQPLPQDVLATSLVPTLRQQLAELKRTYQEKLQIFKPEYPEMLQLKGQMQELEQQIAAEYSAARAALKAEYSAAVSNEQMLKDKLSALRNETLDTDNRSINYNILKREADTNRQLYDSLLQRYKQVSVASDIRPNHISIIDRAQIPAAPFKPNLILNLLIALALGSGLGIALAILREFLDDALKNPEDIEQQLGQPVLGIIPKLSARQTLGKEASNPRSAFSEAYRSTRTALQFSTDHGTPKVLLITSTEPGEGKSTSALALARNFAQLGKRVLLIEGDLRDPTLHKTLVLPPGKGLSNLLAGGNRLEDALIRDSHGGPDILLAGPLPPNPAELLAGLRLRVLFDIVLNRYDQIIIDGPPVMGIADSLLLAHAGNAATLLVVKAGRTRIRHAQATIKRLMTARTRLLGVLLTQYEIKAANYGYYAYGAPHPPRLGSH